jgi:hypothetical protein
MTKPTAAANAAGLSPRPLDDLDLGLVHLERLFDLIIDEAGGVRCTELRPGAATHLDSLDSLCWIGRDFVRRLSGIVEAMGAAS